MTCEEIRRVFRSCPGKRPVRTCCCHESKVEIQHNEVRDDNDLFRGDEYEDEDPFSSMESSWNQSAGFGYPMEQELQQFGAMMGFLGAMLGGMDFDPTEEGDFRYPQSFEGGYDDFAPIPRENSAQSAPSQSPPPAVAPHVYVYLLSVSVENILHLLLQNDQVSGIYLPIYR